MRLKHRVSFNSVYLDQLDDRILVTGYDEQAANYSLQTVSLAGGGQRVTADRRESLEVNVRFALRIKPNLMADRGELFQKVAAWAAVGPAYLRMNAHPGMRLYARCVKLPSAGDLMDWTSEYTITFRAMEVPYWQDSEATTLITVNGKKQINRNVNIPGTAETVADVEFKITSGTLAKFTITAGDSKIVLQNLDMSAGETLVISHYHYTGYIRIRIKNASGSYRSAMGARTPESSDDLVVKPGARAISVTAATAGNLSVSCYGRYA